MLVHEVADKVIREHNAKLEDRLKELGPGWAIGTRLRQEPYQTGPHSHRQHVLEMSWEWHEVQLVDGELAEGLSGFHYVTLRGPVTP